LIKEYENLKYFCGSKNNYKPITTTVKYFHEKTKEDYKTYYYSITNVGSKKNIFL